MEGPATSSSIPALKALPKALPNTLPKALRFGPESGGSRPQWGGTRLEEWGSSPPPSPSTIDIQN